MSTNATPANVASNGQLGPCVPDDEPRDLVVRLLAMARDYGAAEDVRLLCGEAAAELDRLETLAAVRDWAATSAAVRPSSRAMS